MAKIRPYAGVEYSIKPGEEGNDSEEWQNIQVATIWNKKDKQGRPMKNSPFKNMNFSRRDYDEEKQEYKQVEAKRVLIEWEDGTEVELQDRYLTVKVGHLFGEKKAEEKKEEQESFDPDAFADA